MMTRSHFVEVFEAGGDADDVAAALADFLQVLHGVGEDVFDLVEAVFFVLLVLVFDVEDTLFGAVQQLRGAATFRLVHALRDFTAAF